MTPVTVACNWLMSAAAAGDLPVAIERVEAMITDIESQLRVLKAMVAASRSTDLPIPIEALLASMWGSHHRNEGSSN